MKTIEVNEVMNASIVVLNNIKSTKLSSVGGKKRAQLRTDKHAAEFILANWDNEAILRASIKDADKSQEDRTKISDEVLNIWRKRIEELKPVDERIVRLNEIAATKLSRGIFKNRREQLKEDRCLAKYVIKNYDSEDALNAILKDKEVRESEVTDIVAKRVKELKKKRLAAAKTSKKTKADISTSEEKETLSKAGRPVSRKIGDRHPKHPEWLWTEYKPGKFDWRTDPTQRKKVGRKPAEINQD